MPIYEVVLAQTYQGQEIINRFNYVGSGSPAAVSLTFALASAMCGGNFTDPAADSVLGRIRQRQASTLAHTELAVKDIFSVTDFYATPLSYSGSRTGVGMSPAVAHGFRTTRTRTDVRRATKRIAGIVEEDVDAGGVLNGAAITAGDNLITAMGATLTYDDEGNTLTFVPAVCGKEKYFPNGEDGAPAYRYYATVEAQTARTMTGFLWQQYTQLRTQVSRQYGRGR